MANFHLHQRKYHNIKSWDHKTMLTPNFDLFVYNTHTPLKKKNLFDLYLDLSSTGSISTTKYTAVISKKH